MKGGGSRLNVNTDKPHSLISIKNKVLPTSPPARQSPQAPPSAARARRPGEREPGAARGAALPSPGRAPPPPAHRRPPRGAPRRDTSRHASGTPSVNKLRARAVPRAPHTLLEAHASCGFLGALLPLALDVYAMRLLFLTFLARDGVSVVIRGLLHAKNR